MGHARRGLGFFTTPIGIVFSTVVIDLISFGIILPLLPLYAERFGASPIAIGMLAATYSLAQFIFAPALGRLSDRIGRRPVILVALAGTAIASLVMGLANSLWVLFVARAFDGTSGASYAVGQAYVADVTAPEERAKGMGLIGAAFGIGFVIGPAIGALCALVSPRLPFFVASALAASNLLLALRRLPESRVAGAVRDATGRGTRLRQALANRAISPLIWVSFIGTFAFVGMETTFTLFGAHRLGYSLAQAALIFVYVGVLSALVQGGLVRPLVARLGEARVLRIGLLTTALGLAAIAPVQATWQLLIACLPLAIGSGLVFPALTAIVSRRTGVHEQGGILGVLASTNGLARVVGPIAATVLFQHVSEGAPYLVGGALFLACLALLVGATRRVISGPGGPEINVTTT
jgi:MFS transporter, DHA1 family, tetracycline resistance protein